MSDTNNTTKENQYHQNYLFKKSLSKGEYKLCKHSKMDRFIEDTKKLINRLLFVISNI